jgi:hypothetical protein
MNTASIPAAIDIPQQAAASNPLRPLFITVLAAKVAVAAILLTAASFAPPVSADESYFSASN